MGKVLPILLALVGLAAGGWAGLQMKPAQTAASDTANCPAPEAAGETAIPGGEKSKGASAAAISAPDAAREYVKLNNQFVVPVVDAGRVAAMVVLSLSIEVTPGQTEAVYSREPRLRDTLLQVMFDHANTGGFAGAFTASTSLDPLRRALLEAARVAVGPVVTDVLIIEVARQDV